MNEVDLLIQEIKDLHLRIKAIRQECKHPDEFVHYHWCDSSDDYDHVAEDKVTVYFCAACKKEWQVKGFTNKLGTRATSTQVDESKKYWRYGRV